MEKCRKDKLTVLIPTYNCSNNIEKCIKSVKWAEEILVVDGAKENYSTDNTVELAKKMGARVIQHKYEYSAKQKNWAIPKAKNKWILLLDSDEIVTGELKKEIIKLLKSEDLNKYEGFGIARRHYFLGKWLRWGGRYPLYNIRLFRCSCRYEDRDVHAHIILPKKKVKYLKGDILHLSDPSLDHFFEKFNRYTTYQANYMLKFIQKKNKIEWPKFFTHYIYAKSVIKDYWYFLPLTSFMRFIYMYIIRLGFLDGRHGFLIATLYSFQDFVSKTKYLELKGRNPILRFTIQNYIKKIIPKNEYFREISDKITVI
ncbi:MAG: glycosyltransferase family 2 protein [Patescibacteria group bacterium]